LLGLLSSSKSLTVVPLVDSLLSELLVNFGSEHFLGDSLVGAGLDDFWKSEEGWFLDLLDTRKLGGSGIWDWSLSVLTVLSWEENECLLVFVKSINVLLHGISILVVSSVVNSDTDRLSPRT